MTSNNILLFKGIADILLTIPNFREDFAQKNSTRNALRFISFFGKNYFPKKIDIPNVTLSVGNFSDAFFKWTLIALLMKWFETIKYKYVTFMELPIFELSTLVEYVKIHTDSPVKMRFYNNDITYYVSNSNLELPNSFKCELKLIRSIIICVKMSYLLKHMLLKIYQCQKYYWI